jgi:twitching motility two-component system response regulator PilG
VIKDEPRRQTIPFSGSAPPTGLAGSAGLQNLAKGVETGVRAKPVETATRLEGAGFNLRPGGDPGIHAPNVAFATPRSPEPARPPDAMKNRPPVVPFTRTSSAPAIAISAQPSARWRCPFCQHAADTPARKCPSCRAVTVLEDLKEVERNEGVVERLVRDALTKLQRLPADKREFDNHLHLALAHLNLREASAAIPHLKAAVSAKRNDWTLMGILDQIQWRKVVMVVDDSLTVRKALSSTLEKNDYRVELAEDGSQALSRLNDTIPDLVLLDITMPGMDGYQVCRTIKEKALTRKVPVIMLSGKDGLFDKVRGKLAGANDYITKPFQTDHLLKTLKKYLP